MRHRKGYVPGRREHGIGGEDRGVTYIEFTYYANVIALKTDGVYRCMIKYPSKSTFSDVRISDDTPLNARVRIPRLINAHEVVKKIPFIFDIDPLYKENMISFDAVGVPKDYLLDVINSVKRMESQEELNETVEMVEEMQRMLIEGSKGDLATPTGRPKQMKRVTKHVMASHLNNFVDSSFEDSHELRYGFTCGRETRELDEGDMYARKEPIKLTIGPGEWGDLVFF